MLPFMVNCSFEMKYRFSSLANIFMLPFKITYTVASLWPFTGTELEYNSVFTGNFLCKLVIFVILFAHVFQH